MELLRKVKYIFSVEIHLSFGIPLMIGAKQAHPDKFCLNMMGDSAFGMSGLDIETSARVKNTKNINQKTTPKERGFLLLEDTTKKSAFYFFVVIPATGN